MLPSIKAAACRRNRTSIREPSPPYGLTSIFISTLIALLVVRPVAAETILNFGIYVADKPTEVVRQFRPILSSLEIALGKKLGDVVQIRMQVAHTYEKGIEDITTGRVDFSRFGPAAYVLAKDANPGVTLLAMESVKGGRKFNGIICVPVDSPIQEVAELSGKTFAFGDERSTIGRYLSQLYLVQRGVTASKLKKFAYLGRHDRVGTAVGAKEFDAGALKESTFKKLVAKGVKIREIARFPNVTKPWIARNGLPNDIFDALRTVLLEMNDPVALKALKKDGFLQAREFDYEVTREAIETNSAFFQ